MLNQQQIYLFGQIQTSQTGGPLYSDTSPIVSVPTKFNTLEWIYKTLFDKKIKTTVKNCKND